MIWHNVYVKSRVYSAMRCYCVQHAFTASVGTSFNFEPPDHNRQTITDPRKGVINNRP